MNFRQAMWCIDAEMKHMSHEWMKAATFHQTESDVDFMRCIVDDDIVYAFRSTEDKSPEDWKRNLMLWPTDKRHTGAYKSAVDVLDCLSNAELALDSRRHVFIGYSYGGAVAQVLGEIVGKIRKRDVLVITFGAYKVFTWCFKPDVHYHHHRLINGNDPIYAYPLIPYKHIGQYYHIGAIGDGWNILDHYWNGYKENVLRWDGSLVAL